MRVDLKNRFASLLFSFIGLILLLCVRESWWEESYVTSCRCFSSAKLHRLRPRQRLESRDHMSEITWPTITVTRFRHLLPKVQKSKKSLGTLRIFPGLFHQGSSRKLASLIHFNQNDHVTIPIEGQSFVLCKKLSPNTLSSSKFLACFSTWFHVILKVLMCLTCHNRLDAGRSRSDRWQRDFWHRTKTDQTEFVVARLTHVTNA